MIFSRTKGWIGVDLGTHTVKLAQVERRGGRVRLLDALILRRHAPWNIDSATDSASAEEVRAALSLGSGFTGADAAVILPMTVCDVRPANVDPEQEPDTRDAVRRQLNAVHGGTEEVLNFDYWQPHGSGQSGENTLVTSIPAVWTERVAQDMGECGLVGQVLDALPLALARAVALSSPGLTEPVIAVDWGYRNATLCVVRRGQSVFVRALRECGFADMLTTICQSLDLTADEAQKLLRDWGLPDRNQQTVEELQTVIEEVARQPLNAFAEELNRTITYLKQQRRSIAPAKLLLLGGGAAVRNIAEYLHGKVELPVEVWRLGGSRGGGSSQFQAPIEMLGPAIALSSLAWATA